MRRWISLFGLFVGLTGTTGCLVVDCKGGDVRDDDGEDGEGGEGEGGAAEGGAGEGGSGGDEAPASRLFVLGAEGVSTYTRPEAIEGRAEASTLLAAGSVTDMYGPRDLAVSESGELFVATENGAAVVVYEDALSATGEKLPSRKITGPSTGIEVPNGLALDEETDVLYVVNNLSNGATNPAILAFSEASAANGDVAPARSIDVDYAGYAPLQIVEADDRLYVVSQSESTSSVLVFDHASTLFGLARPDRVISDDAWGQVITINVGADDRLVATSSGSAIFFYDGASTLDGAIEPTAELEVQAAQSLSAVTFSKDGTMFAADSSAALILSFNAGDPASGPIAPAHSFDGLAIRLPSRMVLVE